MKFQSSMFVRLWVLALAGCATALGAQVSPDLGHTGGIVLNELPARGAARLEVSSPGFKAGELIPWQYTQYGENRFPGLSWSKGPAGTRSYVVVVQSKSLSRAEAPAAVGLTIFHLPANVTSLAEGMTKLPENAYFGENVHGLASPYVGPHVHIAAPNGIHFQVFALDSEMDLPPATGMKALMAAMRDHVVASGELMGTSMRKPDAAADQDLRKTPAHLDTGLVQGVAGRDAQVTVYKGIPYAAPPVGDLRFKAPQPPAKWEGVRVADKFGALCPQVRMAGAGDKGEMSEDCLTANVWTGASFAGEGRPVYVWIYGGGFSFGTGSSTEFDGEALAKRGVVVVTFNYRLGALGFLATPELSKESGHNASGNFGLLDDIALLQWVQRNIAAFGGDPQRVTIGGQSAGAGSCGMLSMSPLAKGLFQRAILESHARHPQDTELRYLSVSHRPLAHAEEDGLKWQAAHGAANIAELRSKPWQEMVDQKTLNDDVVETGSDAKPPQFRPVIDGWVLPRNYSATMAARAQNNVTILAGNNRDETGAVPEMNFDTLRAARSAQRPGAPKINLTIADLQSSAQRKYGPLAGEFLKLYPAKTDDEAAQRNDDSVRDNSRVSTWLWAQLWKPGTQKPVYTYFWTHRPTGAANGAFHGSEIIFAFNNLDLMPNRQWTEQDRKVADTISSYWINYIAAGNPNAPGLPEWPMWQSSKPTVMELGDQFAPISVATPERIDFWKRFFATQPAW